MFTGLIEEIGIIKSQQALDDGLRIHVSSQLVLGDAKRGDSIAVDGCCLTVEDINDGALQFYASGETLRKTSLGQRRAGQGVNLERCITMATRLGGHMVSGHVDARGEFLFATPQGDSWEVRIGAPPAILHQSIAKGSIAVDGISLTIVDLTERDFSLWIIPETWQRTTLSQRRPGDAVNLESDLVGKYVFRFMETQGKLFRA